MFYVFCTLLCVRSSIAIILIGKRELVALLNLSSWCLVMVDRLFLAVSQGCLQFVIVEFPDHTHLLFLKYVLPLLTLLSFSFTLGVYVRYNVCILCINYNNYCRSHILPLSHISRLSKPEPPWLNLRFSLALTICES